MNGNMPNERGRGRRFAALATTVLAAGMLSAGSAAWAQAARGRVWEPSTFGYAVLSTVVFGLVGIIMTIIGFKLFDAFIPFSLEQEICEKQNIAVAILCAAIVLGVSIIVAIAII
jgi:hypothetical protein